MAESIDVAALQRQIEELQAQLAAAQRIDTGGGAVVEGAVRTSGGHFIGRDFIQTITQVVRPGEDEEEAKSVIAHYLHALASDLAGLKLGEIDGSADPKREPLQLADVYVPLNTSLRIPSDFVLTKWLEEVRNGPDVGRARNIESRSVSVLEAAAHHRELTLLGLPGSGKSTFGAHLLLALAQTWQGHPDALAEQESGWSHSGLLPIRVVLRRFADQLPAGDAPARAGDVWEFIARDLKAAGYGLSERVSEYVQRLARRHGAYFLLDGLDECGDAQRRGRVMAAVDELMRNAGSACRFVLTARPYAWAAGPDAERGVYALADFDDDQVQQFITAWYAALVKRGWSNPGEAERKRDDLLNAWQRPDLVPLARNPLLLTLMATLHTNKGRLPDDRADLYEDSVELLMLRWNRQIGADRALLDELAMPGLKLADLRSVLAKLAFEVHEQNAGREGAADIGEGRLERAFRPLLNEDRNKAAKVAEYIEKRAGLLIGQGEKDGERQFAFPHRTFQEFLAACYLKTLTDFAAQCHRLARTAPDHWRVVLPLAARLAEAERGAGAADALIESTAVADFARTRRPDPADWTCALLAGSQLVEIGLSAVRSNGQRRAIAARVAGWLAAALPVHPDQGGLPVKRRAEAGDVLAALGDPRFHGPERYCLPTDENLGFVRIPADPDFSIGTRDEDNPVWRKASGPIPMMTR